VYSPGAANRLQARTITQVRPHNCRARRLVNPASWWQDPRSQAGLFRPPAEQTGTLRPSAEQNGSGGL